MKKLNKVLAIILAILMVTSIVPFTASAEDDLITGTNGQDITWELNRTTGVLTFSGEGDMPGAYSATSTPEWAYYKSSIQKVVINNGITSITGYAFFGCYKITEVSIPDSVKNIQDYAFGYCTGLESITIPYSVSVIQTGAFDGCTNLKDVYYTGSRHEWNEIVFDDYNENLWYHPTIHFMVGDYCGWTFDEETGTLTINDEGAGQIYSYYNSTGQERPWEEVIDDVKHLVIDENIKFIGEYAFAYADSLETVTMLGVEEIDYNVFYCCSSLKSITVGDKLRSILDSFYECDKLTFIYYSGTREQWNDVYLYDYYEVLQEVKVYPSDYVVFSGYGSCVGLVGGDGLSWIFDANTYTLTISGEGALPDFPSGLFVTYRYIGYRDWEFYKHDIKKVVVNDGVTYIGDNYFRFLPRLTTVVIPATVTEIGVGAFRTCESITDVYFKGTEEQWKAITVGNKNEALLNANIHYNYVECEHSYDKSFVTEPSCINYGYTTHICSLCNDSYVDTFVNGVDCTYVPIVTPPTCTEKGYTTYKCPVCYSEYIDDYVDASGHNYEKTSTKLPTCTSNGYTTYECIECGKINKDDYVSSLGHEMSDVVETVAPTCTERGYKKSTCTRCETVFKSDYVDASGHNNVEISRIEPKCSNVGSVTYKCLVCSTETTETISSLGHDWSDYQVEYEPTCTKEGKEHRQCLRCGMKTGIRSIPANGHTFGEWIQPEDAVCGEYCRFKNTCTICGFETVMDAKAKHIYTSVVTAPTCVEQGYTTFTCKCGDTYVADYVEIDADNHSYTSEITAEATHTTEGVITFSCVCGDTYTEVIAKTPEHTYTAVTTAPTCTEQGYTTHTCACGDSYVDNYVDAKGHSHTSSITTPATHIATGVMTYTCTCGDSYTEEIAKTTEHTYKAETTPPTCTEQGYTTHTCECGDIYIGDYVDALGHNYSSVVIAPTCTAEGYTKHTCTVCGDSYGNSYTDATGHAYTNIVMTFATCTEQGYTTYTCECGDTYKSDYVDALGHNYNATVTPPTCTEQGYTTYTCECGDTYTSDYVDSLGHNIIIDEAVSPDCLNTGLTAGEHCSRCDYRVEQTVVDALGHTYESVVTPPTCTEYGYTTYTCECGDSYIGDYVDALGHNSNSIVITPTCTAEGYTKHTCTVCGEIYGSNYTNATGHSYTSAVTPPTCTEQGYTTYTCECGDSYVDNYTDATGHADNDGDGYCDADNELLDPTVECNHRCHKTGFAGFIWKIINLFNRLFGLNKTCDCGAAHY